MKLVLNTDQRKLLKLKSSILVHSSEDESKSRFIAKKVYDKDKMLDVFVENIRSKELSAKDLQLLNVIGL
jgi:hypothetical protein